MLSDAFRELIKNLVPKNDSDDFLVWQTLMIDRQENAERLSRTVTHYFI